MRVFFHSFFVEEKEVNNNIPYLCIFISQQDRSSFFYRDKVALAPFCTGGTQKRKKKEGEGEGGLP